MGGPWRRSPKGEVWDATAWGDTHRDFLFKAYARVYLGLKRPRGQGRRGLPSGQGVVEEHISWSRRH
eukprot:6732220-Pyramimonas_sp.AAC.1